MGFHIETVFSGKVNQPWYGFRMYNRSATTLVDGDVVCFWFKTSGDTTATTTAHWCRLASQGDGAGVFSGQGYTTTTQKVAGVVYGGSIAQGASGIIIMAGPVPMKVSGTIVTNRPLGLSGSKGVATGSPALTESKAFAIAMESTVTSTAQTINALMIPQRA